MYAVICVRLIYVQNGSVSVCMLDALFFCWGVGGG